MAGFAGRGAVTHVHDDLEATALVFANDVSGPGRGRAGFDIALAIVACDLLSLGDDEMARIREAVEEISGVPGERVWVSSSHTHYGPATSRFGGLTVESPVPQNVVDYLDNLRWTVAGAVSEAVAAMRPAGVKWGSGATAIGINRRERLPDGRIILGQNSDGAFDPRVALLRVDDERGKPIATMVNYACHGVSLGSTCQEASADFIGMARRVVEEETGARCLYIQGAAGNVNPIVMSNDWSNPKSLGLQLAAEALKTFRVVRGYPEDSAGAVEVRAVRRELQLPGLLGSKSLEVARTRLAACHTEVQRFESEGDRSGAHWAKVRLERAHRDLRVLSGEEEAPVVRAELCAARLGGAVALVSAPGEVFSEIGTSIIERSPFEMTLYCGYTNGSIHYIPTRSAYAEGGYEVVNACIVAPEAGERLEEESVELLDGLAKAGPQTT